MEFTVSLTVGDFIFPLRHWEKTKKINGLVSRGVRGWNDVFGKPQAETVRPAGSAQCFDGKLKVKANVKLAVKV